MSQALRILPDKCTGCMQCELACSWVQTGTFQPSRSLVRVHVFDEEASYAPYTCVQCDEAWCMNACPVNAIALDEQTGAKIVLEQLCIGCHLCTIACPFGTVWTLPSSGGTAKAITDFYNDARHPTFSPDGKTIAFQGYRAGNYDIWAVGSDGSNQRQLTRGPFDDREPAWSHDGSRVAFSSDRGESISAGQPAAGSGNYNIWILDTRNGQLTQVTKDRADDFMPTWSPDAPLDRGEPRP